MIDRTEKPKIPSKFAKRDANNLPVRNNELVAYTDRESLVSADVFGFQSLSILCKTKKLSSVWRNNTCHWAVLKIELYKSSVVMVLYSVFGCDRSIAVFRFRAILRAVVGFL